MRLSLTIIISLISISLFGQTASPIGQYSKLYEYKNGLRIDSAAFMPRRDTFTTDPTMKAAGMLLYSLTDSIMYYRNSFAWKPLFSAASVATIYTQDGTLTGTRQIHLDAHQLQFIDDNSTFGETKINMDAGGNIALTAKAPFGDPNFNNFAGVVSVFPYATYIGSEGLAHLTHVDVDTVSSRLLFNSFSASDAHAGYENKLGVDNTGLFFNHGFIDHPSVVNTTLLRIDSLGNTTLNRYKNTVAEDSVLTTTSTGLMKMKYVSAASWDSTKIIDSTIHNQRVSPQTANYYISGQGISASYNSYNTLSATYVPYQSFSTDGIDTTKRLWSIGLGGTTGPGNSGGNLVFRSYLSNGLFLGNAMTLVRSGILTVQSGISVPAINFAGGVTGGGSNVGVGATFATTLSHGGATYNNGTSTPTGDYTTSATDTWINVNNTANCTITINNPGSGLAAAGRIYHIKKISNNAFTVTIVCSNGTTLIEGATSLVISSFNTAVTLHDDGTNWFVY